MNVFVTRRIPQVGLKLLENECDVEVSPEDRRLSKAEIIEGVKGKDGLLCLLTDTIDKEVFSAEPNLRMVANYAVGYDNIDVQEATKRGIGVSNTPGVLTDTTAEMAWALLFAAARRLIEGDAFVRAGKFKGWAPRLLLGNDISQKKLGIIGAGRIGTAFGLKSKGFNMDVMYVNPSRNTVLEKNVHARKVTLQDLLEQSDFISLHVPLRSSTKHMIGESELKSMKSSAILINTSRGPVIDEKALIKALEEKWIFATGLDVYEHEPEIPAALCNLDNVVLQPHAGSATFETRSKMAEVAAENLINGLKGKMPPNCVNPEVFKNK